MATPAAINVIANQPVYLVHNNGRKFWEITVRGRFNDIRYGKLRRANEQGVEEMLSEHNTVERALSRAYELIRIKRTRGYSDLPTFTAAQVVQNTTISSSGVFRGTFLDFTVGRSNKFWSIQINGRRTKVEWGRIGTKGQAILRDYNTAQEAQDDAQALIREKVSKGYRRDDAQFVYDFN